MKKHKYFTFLLFVVLAIVFWKRIDNARYVDPGIRSPTYFLSNGDWSYVEFSIQEWQDSGGKYYILRKYSYAYNPFVGENPTGFDFSHWQGVIDYFDDELKEKGWIRSRDGCRNFLAETEVLPFEEENGYVVYQKRETIDDYESTPAICLFVWDLDNDGIPRFHVLLASINPAFGNGEIFTIK